MLYESVNDMKLSQFIRLATGDVRAAIKEGEHTDEECAERSSDLIMEYMDLCNNKAVLARLEKQKKHLKLTIKMRVLEICGVLIKASQFEDVSNILSEIGYKIDKDNHQKLQQRVDQLMRKCQFDISLITEEKESGQEMTEKDFTKERVALMSHYKMHIDPNVFTAAEYACLVAQFNREIEDMIKRQARANK